MGGLGAQIGSSSSNPPLISNDHFLDFFFFLCSSALLSIALLDSPDLSSLRNVKHMAVPVMPNKARISFRVFAERDLEKIKIK